MMVKICGITNLDDALAAVDAGASALGFNFYPGSPRYIAPVAAQAIADRVAILRVGVFVNASADDVSRTMTATSMDAAQIHHGAAPENTRFWRALSVDEAFDSSALTEAEAEAFLLDAPAPGVYGGTGETFDWRRVPCSRCKIVLAGGLDASNVARAIAVAKPWGVDACSRLESAPGRKDHKRVREFVAAALEAGI